MIKIQSLLFSNFYLKILSVIIAILLWFFVIGESKNEMGLDASLEFKGIPQDVTIVNDIPSADDVLADDDMLYVVGADNDISDFIGTSK